MKPSFLIIGAQRCGTTNLWWNLNQHPDIAMAAMKEVNYFLRHTGYPQHNWYESQFMDNGRLTGEATPEYCFWPGAIERIHEYDPSTKLIMIMRDPVRRAVSQYWLEFYGGHEDLIIHKALVSIATREASINYKGLQHSLYHHSYLKRGVYHTQLDNIYRYFPKEQAHLIVLEELIASPDEIMEELANFLGIASKWDWDLEIARRKGDYPEPDTKLLKRLYTYYEMSNKLLNAKYGINTDLWRMKETNNA